MSADRHHNELAVRLYNFARRQFADELRNDFPRLRSIQSTQAMFVSDFFRSLSDPDRVLLMDGLLLRVHADVSEMMGDFLTPGHLECLKMFDEQSLATSGKWKYIPLRSKRDYRKFFNEQHRPLPPEVDESDFGDGVPAKLNRRVVFEQLRAKLEADCWGGLVNCGAGTWECSALIRGTPVSLNLDFGASSAQLNYWHDIGDKFRFLSIGKWLGVGSLAWDLCTMSDSVSVAVSVGNLVNEFIEGVFH